MDGTDAAVTVWRPHLSCRISVDPATSRLYWADWDGIQSTNSNGNDLQSVFPITTFSQRPYGIAICGDRVYWGYHDPINSLYCASKRGKGSRAIYQGRKPLQHMAVVGGEFPVKRRNDCNGLRCAGLCVLTPASARCFR